MFAAARHRGQSWRRRVRGARQRFASPTSWHLCKQQSPMGLGHARLRMHSDRAEKPLLTRCTLNTRICSGRQRGQQAEHAHPASLPPSLYSHPLWPWGPRVCVLGRGVRNRGVDAQTLCRAVLQGLQREVDARPRGPQAKALPAELCRGAPTSGGRCWLMRAASPRPSGSASNDSGSHSSFMLMT